MSIRGLFERMHAALLVARLLRCTELRRPPTTSVALTSENGRPAIRRAGGWDYYA